MKRFISLSILSADFNNLGKEIQIINDSDADFIHLDVMDGVFVPNISFGFPIIEHVNKIAQKPLDVHLMIIDPTQYIIPSAKAGASIITVHYEACKQLRHTIRRIKELGVKAGVSLNPNTPVDVLKEVITELDMVLLMSVNPGFGAQKFIEHTIEKVAGLKRMITSKGLDTLIEIDGGVNLETGKRLLEAGADVLVAGNFVFKAKNPIQTIKNLKNINA